MSGERGWLPETEKKGGYRPDVAKEDLEPPSRNPSPTSKPGGAESEDGSDDD